MCVSAEFSINTFIFIIIGIILLYFRNYKYDHFLIPYLIFVATIQLGEYFIWSDIDCKNNLNILGNLIIITSLYFQCFALIYGIYSLDPKLKYNISNINYLFYGIIIILIINYINYIYNLSYKNTALCITKYKNHLSWLITFNENDFIFNTLYFLLPLMLLIIKNFFISFTLISFFYFILLLSYYKFSAGKEWLSIWCLLGGFIPYIILIIGYIDKYIRI